MRARDSDANPDGSYVSFNRRKTFMPLDSLRSAPVHDIVVQKKGNEIVIGTHGGSIYIDSSDDIYKIYKKLIK